MTGLLDVKGLTEFWNDKPWTTNNIARLLICGKTNLARLTCFRKSDVVRPTILGCRNYEG